MVRVPLVFVEVLRYAASGFIIFLYLYIADPYSANVLAEFGAAVVAVGALAVGALTYILYRSILFNWFVRWLQDLCRSYRTWLMDRYKLSRSQAVILYTAVRPHLAQSEERTTHFANVHYGYMASLLTVPFFFISRHVDRAAYGEGLLAFGVVLFALTLSFHRRGELEELLEISRFSREHPDIINNLAKLVREEVPRGLEILPNLSMLFPALRLLGAIRSTEWMPPSVGVCLEGDTTLRLAGAAFLFREELIDRIIVSGGVNEPSSDRLPATLMKEKLIEQGVPTKAILLEEESQSTHDHPGFVNRIAKAHSLRRLVIITSPNHLLRAYLRFLKELSDSACPYQLYGYAVGTRRVWFQRSPTEGRYRFWSFYWDELPKIRTYTDLSTFRDAWEYIRTLRSISD